MKYIVVFLLLFSFPALADHILPGEPGTISWYCDNAEIIEKVYLSSGDEEATKLLGTGGCWSFSYPVGAVTVEYIKTVFDANIGHSFEIYKIFMSLHGLGFTAIKLEGQSI